VSALRAPAPPAPPVRRGAVESTASWSRLDRLGLALCWAAGIALCAICAAILLFMLVKGLQFLRPALLVSHPLPDLDQSKTGGFLDPLIGTVVLTLVGIAFALPVGVSTAVWLSTAVRPGWRAPSSRGSRSSPGRRASCSRSSG
jgi:phosphate transport system permease protein